MGSLFKNTLYTNKNFNFVKGTIREFDMKSGGLNIIKSLKLLPEDKIKELEQMDKKKRNIKIGLYMRYDKNLNKRLTAGFGEYVEKFFKANNIEDRYVLAIKKDAVFLINKGIKVDTFDSVKFVMKNRYTSYFYLNKVEYYFNSTTKQLDVKGINDDKLKYHTKHMLKFLKKMFYYIEMNDTKNSIRYLKKFADKYRKMELPVGYYRELNDESEFVFKYNIAKSAYGWHHHSNGLDDIKDQLDITYNYLNIILNIAKLIYR